jgi:hypothetical protein
MSTQRTFPRRKHADWSRQAPMKAFLAPTVLKSARAASAPESALSAFSARCTSVASRCPCTRTAGEALASVSEGIHAVMVVFGGEGHRLTEVSGGGRWRGACEGGTAAGTGGGGGSGCREQGGRRSRGGRRLRERGEHPFPRVEEGVGGAGSRSRGRKGCARVAGKRSGGRSGWGLARGTGSLRTGAGLRVGGKAFREVKRTGARLCQGRAPVGGMGGRARNRWRRAAWMYGGGRKGFQMRLGDPRSSYLQRDLRPPDPFSSASRAR